MSAGATDPTPARPAFCPKCNGEMGQRDARCPHCGYAFSAPDTEAHLLPWWAWLAMIAVVGAAIYFGVSDWLEIAACAFALGFIVLSAVWRRWDRYWNRS